MIYEWKFGPAEVYTDEFFRDAVSHVMWWCVGFAPDGSAYKERGTVRLDPPDRSRFMAFDGITESIVRDWVFGKISRSDVERRLSMQHEANTAADVRDFNF
jgi:hypothetical protein